MGTGLNKSIVSIVIGWLCCWLCVSCTCGKKGAPQETQNPQQAVTSNQAPASEAAVPAASLPLTTASSPTPVTGGKQTSAPPVTPDLTQIPEVTPEELANDPRLKGLPERTKYVLKALEKVQQRMPQPQTHAGEQTSLPRPEALKPSNY